MRGATGRVINSGKVFSVPAHRITVDPPDCLERGLPNGDAGLEVEGDLDSLKERDPDEE